MIIFKKKFKKLSCTFAFIIFAVFTATASTSSPENNNSPEGEETADLLFRDHIYKKNIKSAQLFIMKEQMSFPVIFLNDQKQLSLHFDDFSRQYQTYSYKFIHCNSNWEPSGLQEQEYLAGFMSGFIEEFRYSFNTLFSYIHYQLNFPNQDIHFKLSGNYLLLVYANNNEDDLVLTRRFYVVDKRVKIDSKIHMATLARYRDFKQEVDLIINHQNYPIQDPFSDLRIVISQNRRWDNAITGLKPLFIRTPELVYNYEDDNLFDGNNEFRFFDAKDLRYQSINVERIQIENGKTNLYLAQEEPRSYKRYYNQPDINGKRLIKRDDSRNSNLEADYINAHFKLKRSDRIQGGDLFVFGGLSDWELKEEFKMDYNEIEEVYQLKTVLKQGYYNYMYAFLPSGESKADLSIIEGTHSQTENDYYIFVYHRKNGEIYDRLVGFKIDNSIKSLDD